MRIVLLPDEWTDEECSKVVQTWEKNLGKEKLHLVLDSVVRVRPSSEITGEGQEEGQPEESNPEEQVNHPAHYGGATNPFEAIKVIEAWGLGFCLGNTVKYISRAGKKVLSPDDEAAIAITKLVDLRKAAWYLNREISYLEAVCD